MTQRWMWFSGDYSPTQSTPSILEYCAENDWGLEWSLAAALLGSYEISAEMKAHPDIHVTPNRVETEVLPAIEACEDYGVNCMFDIEMGLFTYPYPGTDPTYPVQHTDTASDYDEYYSATMDILESESALYGYSYELGWDNAAEWLRNTTDKHITFFWASEANGHNGYGYPVPTGIDPTWDSPHDLDWRLALVDSVVYELYETNCYPEATPLLQYLMANYPDMPFGVITNVNWDDEPLPITATLWQPTLNWPTAGARLGLPEADGKTIALRYLYQLKEATAPFSENHLWVRTVVNEYAKQADWFNLLPIYDAGSKYLQEMSEWGVIPTYAAPGPYCTYPGWVSDIFGNTGNELILLKEYDDACRAHDITVTSTDTLTYEDYTLTLSPERGTFIGPYPLDDYGALPTITYDNTNLYVSVLKVEPTA